MKTYSLICKKIILYPNGIKNPAEQVHWIITRSEDIKDFPIGLLISTEQTAKRISGREDALDNLLGPPFFDGDFEEWLNNMNLDSLNTLKIKPKKNLKILSPKNTYEQGIFASEDDSKYNVFNAICYVEKFTCDEDGEYVHLLISLERRHFAEDYFLINEENPHRISEDRQRIDNLVKDNLSNKEGYAYLESLIKNMNSKLEELLENMFYSSNSMLNRVNGLEIKIANIEKADYVQTKNFNTVELFFRGGIKNLLVFLSMLLLFKEIFVYGPLQHIRVLNLIETIFQINPADSTPEEVNPNEPPTW